MEHRDTIPTRHLLQLNLKHSFNLLNQGRDFQACWCDLGAQAHGLDFDYSLCLLESPVWAESKTLRVPHSSWKHTVHILHTEEELRGQKMSIHTQCRK